MAEKIVKGIMTIDGIAQVDYESLANLPTIDVVPTFGSRNAVESNGVYNALSDKLDKNATAVNSEKLGGQDVEYFATAGDIQSLTEEFNNTTTEINQTITNVSNKVNSTTDGLNTKLDKTAQAADSAKLNGKSASYYATDQAVEDAQTTANTAMSSATDALNKINKLILDITVIDYVTQLPASPVSTTLYLIPK